MLKLIGYADRFSVAPGETIRFMVSALEDQPYQAEIVRLIHGDANPEGPGFKSEQVPSGVEAAHVGRRQAIARRLLGAGPVPSAAEGARSSFTVAAMIWPTTPGKGRQGLIGHWDEEAARRLAARDRRAGPPRGAGRRRPGGGRGRERRAAASRRHWYWWRPDYDAAAGHADRRPAAGDRLRRGDGRRHRRAGRPPPRSSRTARSRWRRCAPATASAATTTAGSTARG